MQIAVMQALIDHERENFVPVVLKKNHPAIPILQQEGYHVLEKRPGTAVLRIGLLNLMPKKIETEGQFARVLSNSVVNVELVFLQMTSHIPRHVSPEHMRTFYQTWRTVTQRGRQLDGLIVTGAPVELLDYEAVDYWEELREVFHFVQEHKICTLFVCWAAQAALYSYFGIQKHRLPEKVFGIYQHRLSAAHPLFLGFDDTFLVPVSRHTGIQKSAVEAIDGLNILSESSDSGLYALCHTELPQFFLFNHLEYETETIGNEYLRDLERGDSITRPHNYFNDSSEGVLLHRWRSYATLLHSNWIHICVNEQQKRMKGMRRVRVGIAGDTPIADAVIQQFYKRRDVIEIKTGAYIEIVSSKRNAATGELQDANARAQSDLELVESDDIDVIVETHESESFGKNLVERALANRKSLIATNARILAEHGLAIIQKAEEQKTLFSYESIVGSGIPVLKTIREALASDRIQQIHAVLSAPSNMLLALVEQQGTSIAALQKKRTVISKKNGHSLVLPLEERYITGYDTAFKLNVLSCIGFGKNFLINAMPIYGINALKANDIAYAKHCGFSIKLCGYARDAGEYITAWVGPMLLAHSGDYALRNLAFAETAQNALLCRSQAVGDLFLQGPGIGTEPAANAVLSDLVDILVSSTMRRSFGVPASEIPTLSCKLPDESWQWFVRSSRAIAFEELPYTRQEYFEGSWFLFSETMSAQQFLTRCPQDVLFFAPCYTTLET